jgi:Asp-tRNA(Asn)/Glu-tRNA(Gln) amidotransferase A subunit family amidase
VVTASQPQSVAARAFRHAEEALRAQPSEDAAVRQLRDCGAILFAKVATHEFGLCVTTPQCRNPYDPTRLASGSSAGSTTPMVAPPAGDYEPHLLRLSRHTILWSMVGTPTPSIPCGPPGAMPVGLQIVAPPYKEQLLFDVGAALEHVLPPTEIQRG